MPVLFTPAALQRIADLTQRDFLSDTCDIGRESKTTTAMGGRSGSFPVAHAGVPCAVIDAGLPIEQVVAAQVVGSILKIIALPRGTDIKGNDQIVTGGLTYHVIDLYEPSTFEVVRRVLVRQLTL